ncbi:hypothetical protein AYI68_g7049, partial [Smittium mucronatum]
MPEIVSIGWLASTMIHEGSRISANWTATWRWNSVFSYTSRP